jgi:primosomal protein N'
MNSSFLVTVSLSMNIFDTLTYRYTGDSDKLKVGQRVVVPLMNRLTTGWVMSLDSDYKGRSKSILGIVDDGYLPLTSFIDYARAVSGVYFTSAGLVLDGSVSPKGKSINNLCFQQGDEIRKLKDSALKDLNSLAKKEALRFYVKTKAKKQDPNNYNDDNNNQNSQTFLGELKGAPVTDGLYLAPHLEQKKPSGRRRQDNIFLLSSTRLPFYKQRIQETLESGQSVLVAVPDNLTATYLQQHLSEIGIDVDIYNSDVKLSQRESIWQSYVHGARVGVVTGGLSALMLPIPNLGLVITERAGSALYKRTAFSKYNVHQLAKLRAHHQQVPLFEGFSTYTVNAFCKFEDEVTQDQRSPEDHVPVSVHSIPAKEKGVPAAFVELMKHYYIGNKSVLVVVNRKESTDFLFCEKCKKLVKCPVCDGPLKLGDEFHITCTRCALKKDSYSECPKCNNTHAIVENLSIASIKRAIKGNVVETGVVTLSAEDFKKKDDSVTQKALAAKILVSTPVVVNPFFSRSFDAVVYLRPESQFNLDAYDAAERVFSMASELKELVKPGGQLDIFSTFHFHYSLKLVNEESEFFGREIKYRKWFHLPPFYNVYHIEIKGKKLRQMAVLMRDIYQKHKESLHIKKVYLSGRKANRGTFKGIIEAHALPSDILNSGLLQNRDISIQLELV